jgi:Kef-type K+ transport system membrane component KefB
VQIFLIQLLVIVAVGRTTGALFRRIGQTAVIGEMCAGILLGPSVLGAVSPSLEAGLFPPPSLQSLHLVSQLGVVLFMFLVGMEFDVDHLRGRARATVVISYTGIIVPFALGVLLSAYLYRDYALPGVRFLTFALFTGIAMSVTAFPVLARIIAERGLKGTELGTLAIGCAAIDDVTAWCLLGLVLAIGRGGGVSGPILTVALTGGVALIAFKGVRPRAGRLFGATASLVAPPGVLVPVLLFVFAAALATEAIGVHALFGAFLAGVAVAGAANVREPVRHAVEPLTTAILLPLFFAYSGLRTEVGLLSRDAWVACGVIILAAVAGKFAAISAAARSQGLRWSDSLALGALMNTRGLMELVMLNIGYDLGILSPTLYTMMIIMAIATTCMAGPALAVLGRRSGLANELAANSPIH